MGVVSEGLGRTLNRESVSLLGRSTEAGAATTTHTAQEIGDKASAYLAVVVYTAPTGTSPTLLVTIEGSNDGQTWFTLGKIGTNGYSNGNGTDPSNITAAGTYRGMFPIPRYVRSKGVIGGTSTPTFDYSIGGDAA